MSKFSCYYLSCELFLIQRKTETCANVIVWTLKQPPEVFYKKGVLKNLAKFTAKHLCQSLFLQNTCGRLLQFILYILYPGSEVSNFDILRLKLIGTKVETLAHTYSEK